MGYIYLSPTSVSPSSLKNQSGATMTFFADLRENLLLKGLYQ